MNTRREPLTTGLGSFAAVPGAAVGFCGMFGYLLLWITWQLNIGSSTGALGSALLPHPAQWVTTAMYFTAYGLPSSAVVGAILGLILGGVLGRTRSSSSPALGWVVGTVVAFVLGVLVHLILVGAGTRVVFAQSARLFAIPTMIFILSGGVLGVWLQNARRGWADELAVDYAEDEDADLTSTPTP